MSEHLLIGVATIIILGVSAQWFAWRLRLPSILLLLLFGFLAGPVTHLINPDELLGELLFPVVSIAVAVILFEGGLTLRFSELPRVADVIFRLISVGALLTWVTTAVAAHIITGLDWALSGLLGAILVVTGPTVIGPLLRQVRPKGEVGAVLKWEGILIDPVGAVLAVLVFEAIIEGNLTQVPGAVLLGIGQTIFIGVVGGLVFAGTLILFMRRYWIPDHLQNGVALLLAVSSFVLSNALHPESGLLTVTVMGVVLANQQSVSIRHIVEFKENLTVLLIGFLFILLASRLQLTDLANLGWGSLLFLLVLIGVIRPLSVLVSTFRSRLDLRSRIFLTWMAPRGIVAASVASVFSFELVEAGHEGAEFIVPLTFLVIVGSVLFYGLTAGPVARRLGLAELNPQGLLFVGGHALARRLATAVQELGFRVVLIDTNWQNIVAGQMEGLDMHHGDALSEDVLEECEFDGIGRLLALTSNNEVNSLAALHFPEVFGRAAVYQLPLGARNVAEKLQNKPSHLRGRFLFNAQATYHELMKRFNDGATVKVTALTPQFTYEDYQAHYGNEALPLMLLNGRNELLLFTVNDPPVPRPGHRLISLVPTKVA
ncbi:MAG: cation:proton antiporter [Ardenticatenaceae bacterium]|nr:cation:proton antiporter [Anaerolineales bacterium]MCB8921738.1 cation:proton antiporter [Ardenticatenaceae bacterium]MCB8990743.1 cation:proton antiporter [Ardenticatenaceae bacterium]